MIVPKAVSRLDAKAPNPGFRSGQSAENSANHLGIDTNINYTIKPQRIPVSYPLSLCKASVINLTRIFPEDAVSVILGTVLPVKPSPG